MIFNKSFVVDKSGVRLDAALLAAFPTVSRAFAREAITDGDVLVNGRVAPKGLKLKGGETVSVRELAEASDNLVRPNPAIKPVVVYEDDSLLALDKPAGLPVQPISRKETSTLMNGVVARNPECQTLGDAPLMAGALHRIDADTSGLVLVAKTSEAFAGLREQFSGQTVEKTYLAMVEGSVAVGGTLENYLAHDPTLPFCRMIDADKNRLTLAQRAGLRRLHAVTSFKPLAQVSLESDERTLLEVKIFTGVTHQIRAQLALSGMHIVNDRLYGAFAVEGMTGHCLHALSARFLHPVSGDEMVVTTPYPDWASSALRG